MVAQRLSSFLWLVENGAAFSPRLVQSVAVSDNRKITFPTTPIHCLSTVLSA